MSVSAAANGGMQVTEDQCPICMNEAYLNTTMRLMVAHCGHKYCETCTKRHFTNHQSLNCLICGAKLLKNSFVRSHPKMAPPECTSYNKPKSEFPNLRAYNDYLEQVEDLIYNLVNDVNPEKTKAEIEEYRKKNEAAIVTNQLKKKLAREIQREREEREEQRKKTELKFAEEDAQSHKRPQRTKPQAQSAAVSTAAVGATMTSTAPSGTVAKPSAPSYVPASLAMPKAPVFVQPQPIFNQRPERPADVAAAAKAAGYSESFSRKRCLEEALSSLSISGS